VDWVRKRQEREEGQRKGVKRRRNKEEQTGENDNV